MVNTHANFKSAQSHIKNGRELYEYLKLVFDFQHLFHKRIPPCEKNDWLQRRKRNPKSFIFDVGDIDRMYQCSKSTTTTTGLYNFIYQCSKSTITTTGSYNFIGRINNFSSQPPLYVYVKGTVVVEERRKKMILPDYVSGFIFMSGNVNLFMRCVLFQYYQTQRAFFNHLCNFLKREDDIFLTFDPLQQQKQQILSLPPQKDDNTLLNFCFQIVRNNYYYYYDYDIPLLMREKIEEENIKEAGNVFEEKIPPPHERNKCTICLKNNYEFTKNNDYYILQTDNGSHQLNHRNLCVEMLNFHCDNILEYQHLFKKIKIGKRKKYLKNITIDHQNIYQLYDIYNEYFDLNAKYGGYRVEVIGKLTNQIYYFYILAFTLLPQRGNYKGGFIFFSKYLDMLLYFRTMMNFKRWKCAYYWRKDEVWRKKRNYEHYRDIFFFSRDKTHYKKCKICFYAKFKPVLFDRLLNSQDFIYDHENKQHILRRIYPNVLNYYCDNVLDFQHLFQKTLHSAVEGNVNYKNFIIDIKDIDRIYYVKNELFDFYGFSKDGYSVSIGGRVNKKNNFLYFNMKAWTLTRQIEDLGQYKYGYINFYRNFKWCRLNNYNYYIHKVSNYLTKSHHYLKCKLCFFARTNSVLSDRFINSRDYQIMDNTNYHQLDPDCHLCPEMLDIHCDNILKFQNELEKRISPLETEMWNDNDIMIHLQNIDKLYYIYNERYDSSSSNNNNTFVIKVLGRIKNMVKEYLYFNIYAETFYKNDSKVKFGGKIFFTTDFPLLLRLLLSQDEIKKEEILYRLKREKEGIDAINSLPSAGHKLLFFQNITQIYEKGFTKRYLTTFH